MTVTYRLFRQSDIPALIEMMQAGSAVVGSEERIRHMAAAPHLRAEENFIVALNAASTLAGVSIFMLRPGSGMASGDVVVHPDYRADDVTAELLRRCENRILQRAAAEVPENTPVSLGFGIDAGKDYLQSVLETHGYQAAGGQYVMHIALANPLPKPDFPPEFMLRPFDKIRDGQAVFAVFQECFADHRGDVTKISYEQWSHQFDAPDFDPALWLVLYQADAIAAICLNELKDDTTGVVEILGVRPIFRQRGLGGLLLRYAFHDFQQRGFQQVILDVDTENTTNAVALYEAAGMHIQSHTAHYAKVLREA